MAVAIATPVWVLAGWAALTLIAAVLVAITGTGRQQRFLDSLSPEARQILAGRQRRRRGVPR
jgi:hypothetical protein